MSTAFQIRHYYNFDMHAASILGTSYKNVLLLAIMDYETANREIDTQAIHTNIFPMLPGGTPNAPSGYDFIKVKTSTGQTTILGIPWIIAETVEQVVARTITVRISDVSSSDAQRIRTALLQNGFPSFTLNVSQ